LFAIGVYSARRVGRDRKTGAPRFEATAQGHLVRSKDERTLASAPIYRGIQTIRRVGRPDELWPDLEALFAKAAKAEADITDDL